jgi:hypothetical protein
MDIERKRGDTWPIEITVNADSVPLDVTGTSFILTVDPSKAPTSNTTNLFQLNGVVTNGPNGRVAFTPTPSQVDRVGKFFYDIQMTDGTGAKRTVAEGKFILTQDITKD